MFDAVAAVYRKYATFRGRATRSEYWWFTLFVILVDIVILVGFSAAGQEEAASAFVGVFTLVNLLPTIAVTVRRLHDTGRSGWWYLLNFIPFGALVVLVFLVLESASDNEYGPRPA